MSVDSVSIPELDILLEEPAPGWTHKEEEIMHKYYSELAKRRKVDVLAKKLNRPVTQVYSKAQRMGLG